MPRDYVMAEAARFSLEFACQVIVFEKPWLPGEWVFVELPVWERLLLTGTVANSQVSAVWDKGAAVLDTARPRPMKRKGA